MALTNRNFSPGQRVHPIQARKAFEDRGSWQTVSLVYAGEGKIAVRASDATTRWFKCGEFPRLLAAVPLEAGPVTEPRQLILASRWSILIVPSREGEHATDAAAESAVPAFQLRDGAVTAALTTRPGGTLPLFSVAPSEAIEGVELPAPSAQSTGECASAAILEDDKKSYASLLVANPTLFWKIVFEHHDARERANALIAAQAMAPDFLLVEILRYGALGDVSTIPDLSARYRRMVQGGMPYDDRRAVYALVSESVEYTTEIGAHALIPFIFNEPKRGLVSTAAIDYVDLAKTVEGNPLIRPKELIEFIKTGRTQNPGAIFGGLLYMGDPRICRLLWEIRYTLDQASLDEAVKCTTGFISASTVEFYLDWMESLKGDVNDRAFGSLASGLYLMRRDIKRPQVMMGIRPIPGAGVAQEEITGLAALMPIEEFTQRIADRLRALERAEPEPKVMSEVLSMWGLGVH